MSLWRVTFSAFFTALGFVLACAPGEWWQLALGTVIVVEELARMLDGVRELDREGPQD